MIIETICIAGVILFAIFLIKEKDLRYIVGFLFGFFMTFFVEPRGVMSNNWTWMAIMKPFDYLLFGVPIGIYLIYASAGSVAVFLTKYILKLRKRFGGKLDKVVAYASIITGIIVFVLTLLFGLPAYLGLIFIMFGFYLLVKNPVIFYVGIIALVGDFIIEHLFMLNNQLSYATSYENAGLSFFIGGVIFSALVILLRQTKPKIKA